MKQWVQTGRVLGWMLWVIPGLLQGGEGSDGAIPPERAPFSQGEQLEYRILWKGVQVGEAKLEATRKSGLEAGEEGYSFLFSVESFGWVDRLYPVRSRFESSAPLTVDRSLGLNQDQKEGSKRKKSEVLVDWTDQTARYRSSSRVREAISLEDGTLDTVSILYAFRLKDLALGQTVALPMTNGKKNQTVEIRIVGEEEIMVLGRSWNTWVVEPDLKDLGGVFEKSQEASLRIWISADENRIPLRVRSGIMIGEVEAELVKWNSGLTQSNPSASKNP